MTRKSSKKSGTPDKERPSTHPVRCRTKLDTVAGIKAEMARLYREARSGKVETSDFSKLMFGLKTIVDTISAYELEQRIQTLEESSDGDSNLD